MLDSYKLWKNLLWGLSPGFFLTFLFSSAITFKALDPVFYGNSGCIKCYLVAIFVLLAGVLAILYPAYLLAEVRHSKISSVSKSFLIGLFLIAYGVPVIFAYLINWGLQVGLFS